MGCRNEHMAKGKPEYYRGKKTASRLTNGSLIFTWKINRYLYGYCTQMLENSLAHAAELDTHGYLNLQNFNAWLKQTHNDHIISAMLQLSVVIKASFS